MSTVVLLAFCALVGVMIVVAINRVLGAGKAAGRAVRDTVVGKAVPGAAQSQEFFRAARSSPFDALACLDAGDIDGARRALQKIAYVVHKDRGTHPERVRQFTRLMCLFVAIDPLFARGLQAVIQVVAQSPGLKQTELYPHMPMSIEEARYVLYFAAETGHLHRIKKGNSYLVYPAKVDELTV